MGRSIGTRLFPESLTMIVRRLPRFKVSIRAKILLVILVVVVFLGSMNALYIAQSLSFQRQYDTIIANIATANSLIAYVKPAIDSAMWEIVAGKKTFDQRAQYKILDTVTNSVERLKASTDSDKGKIKLEVILRTLDTLRYYVDLMGEQIEQGSTFDRNLVVLENIRGVSDVLKDSLLEYMLFEVQRTELKYQEMSRNFNRWALANIVALMVVTLFSVIAAWRISDSIYLPIKKLHDRTAEVTREDLDFLITDENPDEITELGMSFNIMVSKIKELLDSKIKEQENLKKSELRALQAQINPHFLYNTLDAIIWMAQSNENQQVIELVQALSSFFRISLSGGKDWIALDEEIQHVRSYLAIQKIRYRDILDYRFEVSQDILDGTTLKLILQPLAENSLYHGIKNKRGGGMIVVRGFKQSKNQLLLQVEDNGIGFLPEELDRIRSVLGNELEETEFLDSGFGIYNVDRRIRLFYGKRYGLEIESQNGEGTCVTVSIPYEKVN